MKFKKQILKEGLYYTGDGKGGRTPVLISKKRIDHWVNQFKEMKESGISIPAPELHTKEAKPESKDGDQWSKSTKGSKSNYGFWDNLELGQTEEGYTTLNGVLYAPSQEDASKIGKTVKETSISVLPEFVDGTGRKWEDVIGHIAVITNPIEPGQPNFEPEENTISMAHFVMNSEEYNEDMSDMSPSVSADPNDLFSMLEQVAGLAIPQGTSPEQLEQALLAALRQKQLDTQNQGGGSLTSPPKNSNLTQVPVVMSNNQNIEEVKVEEAKVEDNISVEMAHLQAQNKGLIAAYTSNKRKELATRLSRIKNLISEDQLKNLSEEISGVEMSFTDEGMEIKSPVEIKLEGIELVSIPMPKNAPVMSLSEDGGQFVIENQPLESGDGRLTDDDAQKLVDNLFSTT